MNPIFHLDYPQSLGTYDDYDAAQRAVDFLSDREFPVENVLIVGTDLRQVERVTGRLTTGRVAAAGAASGLWLGVFVGLLLALFAEPGTAWAAIGGAALIGVVFGTVWALLGFAMTGGRRDFSSVKTVVATRYELLVEHRFREAGAALLAELDRPDPFG